METVRWSSQLVRERSESLHIPFERMVAVSIMEEVIRRFAVSGYADIFLPKYIRQPDKEECKKKAERKLTYYVCGTKDVPFQKRTIGKVFAELFANGKTDELFWSYSIKEEHEQLCVNLTATLHALKTPFKITLKRITQTELVPQEKEILFYTYPDTPLRVKCYPNDYLLAERFLDVIFGMELLSDLSAYDDIYRILGRDIISGRLVWKLLADGCMARRIPIEARRFETLVSYRTNAYMKKKWKTYLRHEKKSTPAWDELLDVMERFFGKIWTGMCENVVYLGDWMPELGRFID